MRILPYGDRALLIECVDAAEVARYDAALRVQRPDGVIDIVPAARTVLVVVDPGVLGVLTLHSLLTRLQLGPTANAAPHESVDTIVVTIDVRYDGLDLTVVASRCGLSEQDVIRLHSGALYRSAFCGFAPGFAYLSGLDPSLTMPRLASPRQRVPAGSVAVAAGYCGVYPRDMPGGWNLLGRTDAVLWDPTRAEPALLSPGTLVRFRAIDS